MSESRFFGDGDDVFAFDSPPAGNGRWVDAGGGEDFIAAGPSRAGQTMDLSGGNDHDRDFLRVQFQPDSTEGPYINGPHAGDYRLHGGYNDWMRAVVDRDGQSKVTDADVPVQTDFFVHGPGAMAFGESKADALLHATFMQKFNPDTQRIHMAGDIDDIEIFDFKFDSKERHDDGTVTGVLKYVWFVNNAVEGIDAGQVVKIGISNSPRFDDNVITHEAGHENAMAAILDWTQEHAFLF